MNVGGSGREIERKSWVIHACGELCVVDTQGNRKACEANGPPLAMYLELDPFWLVKSCLSTVNQKSAQYL